MINNSRTIIHRNQLNILSSWPILSSHLKHRRLYVFCWFSKTLTSSNWCLSILIQGRNKVESGALIFNMSVIWDAQFLWNNMLFFCTTSHSGSNQLQWLLDRSQVEIERKNSEHKAETEYFIYKCFIQKV